MTTSKCCWCCCFSWTKDVWEACSLPKCPKWHATCYFHLFKPKEVDRTKSWEYKNIGGLCSMHFVASISLQDCTLLNMRDLAYFCNECMDDNFEFYLGKNHVKPWRLLTLEPTNFSQVPCLNPKFTLSRVWFVTHVASSPTISQACIALSHLDCISFLFFFN
jgi:hypothetical protein